MSAPLASVAASQLARDLHKMSRAQRKALRARILPLAGPLLTDARARASWSTRIPAAISVRPVVDHARGRVGVQLRVSVADAPHARPYEGLSRQGSSSYFRHPVFGDRDAEWVPQETRPFAWPAVVARGKDLRNAAAAAAEDAAREAGFR